jgi:N-acetylglucosaminylphosphatidylinositol deacetylase
MRLGSGAGSGSSSSSEPDEQDGHGPIAEPGTREVKLIVLKTYPKRIKFLGPLYPLGLKISQAFLRLSSSSSSFSPFSELHANKKPANEPSDQLIITSTMMGYLEALGAMREHDSQLVWFRWLYVGASKYMWSNTLVMV